MEGTTSESVVETQFPLPEGNANGTPCTRAEPTWYLSISNLQFLRQSLEIFKMLVLNHLEKRNDHVRF
jgi:hypothetical protein